MAETSIEWTSGQSGELGYTFNPVEGCQRVSPGCVNCYAERKNKWLHRGENWGPGTPRLQRSDAYWRQPLRWNAEAMKDGERRKVFCASVADVFEDHHDWMSEREKLWALILLTPQLDWLLLTKRPENIERFLPSPSQFGRINGYARGLSRRDDIAVVPTQAHGMVPYSWPLPNVWLGTTVEDNERCVRIPTLRSVPAAVHFLSCEPLLERIHPDLTGIDWVICGGESGPGSRQFDVDWARSLRDQCAAAGIAFMMKQLGARTRMSTDGGDPLPMFFKKGQAVDLAFMPPDLRIRQFPEVRHA